MHKNRYYILIYVFVLLMSSCKDGKTIDLIEIDTPTPEYLPMSVLNLEDLSAFNNAESNCIIVSEVLSDFNKEGDLVTKEGKGILVNHGQSEDQPTTSLKENTIYTNMEHGDILIEFDVLIPKGSISNLLFMSRYGLQVTDNNKSTSSDLVCGGILKPKTGEADVLVALPIVNAARAPGLWQNFKVQFRAPKFNQSGEKEANAKFEYVYHNGYLIHENVELTSPSIAANASNEVSIAPLAIHSRKGPLALKNISYKAFDPDSIRFSEMSYKVYEGRFTEEPDYSNMTPAKSGKTNSFKDIAKLAGWDEDFVIVYEGTFTVPTEGNYLIETIIDDGGDFYIDDSIAVRTSVERGIHMDRNLIHLNAGSHSFVTDCYAFDKWGTRLVLYIEGPNIEKRAYLSDDFVAKREKNRGKQSYDIDIDQSIEMIRGFVDHKGQKLTHTLSVGSPNGIHYTYDTRYNALLNIWKGDFADVSEMWVGRGNQQRLKPRNATLSLNSGIPFIGSELNHDPKGFRLAVDDHPIFSYSHGKVDVTDDIKPNSNGMLTRTLQFENTGKTVNFRIAEEEDIVWLNDEWASIGNLYYLSISGGKEHISIEQSDGVDQLLYSVPRGTTTLSYEISW